MIEYYNITDYGRERREAEEREAMPRVPSTPRPANHGHCLKCGMPLDTSRIDGAFWEFDRNTTTLHRCAKEVRRG